LYDQQGKKMGWFLDLQASLIGGMIMSLFAAPVGAVALSAATIFAIKGRVKLHEACLSASALLMLLTIGVATMAQPLPPNAATPPVPTVGSSEVLVKTVESVDLSAPVPAELSGSLPPQIIHKIGKGGDTVRLAGTSRGVKASGGSSSSIGQIVWNGVTAQVNGRKRVVPLDRPLTSQFIARSTSVPSGTEVKATGDADAIVAAAKKLLDVPEEDTRKAEAKKDTKQQNKATPVGGGGSQNDVAANGYQPAPGVMKAEVPDLPVSYGVTTEGCTPRVDEPQGVVIIQSRETKSEGGAVSPTGACSDSETRYQIQKSYASCSDRVDLEGFKAYAQFRKYWTDDQGRTSFLGDCADDTESAFDIVEDKTACRYAIDLDAKIAYEQAEKVYTNRNNQRITVAPCAHTAAAGMPVTATADACTFRHDFTAHISFQQKRMVYTDVNTNSVTPVSECSDDPTEIYDHVDVRNVCQNLVDQGAGKAWPQRRWQIVPPAGPLWISECEPVQEEATNLVTTVQGCEAVFYHSISAGQSFGAQRFYYSFDGRVRTYVTECQQSAVTYIHQVETQGYQYNDSQKNAQPKTAIYINTPVGRVDVSAAQVRDGAPVLPYAFARTQNTAQPDKKYWEGCNAYVPTVKTDSYTRPDKSEVSYIIGPGTPTGPVDECTRTTENQIVYAYSQMSPADGGIAWVTFYINGGSPTGWSGCAGLGGGCPAMSTNLSLAYNSCHSDLTGAYTLTHFSQAQNRVRTQLPNNGGVTYTAWSNVGGAQLATTIGCSHENPDRG
jgi:hypothetical protein